ncbi:limonene-1,2-epoxide hydrolase family protein [Rhizobium sp. NFR03]|uniref:limonene-1,2-epoxide hydrolase family protein n=1 Tax=Rhizobium sp. NFR03 TaxID=1566263 RepID=UPI0008D640B7|nr:limonene-1,2-epoxide hydrolase family protein [Rhizobium sp. NFR03]SES46040.1 limonene-1,2-epoxide hydrolase [Rhizobium sp. NFR03]
MSTDPIAIATTFFDYWTANRIEDALAMLSDDVLYDNVPLPNISGRDNVRKFHQDFGVGTAFKVDWTVTHIAASGNVVLNERIDIFTHKSGATITLPVMGTVIVEKGVITVWRDYFDLADFERQVSVIKR